MTTPTPTPEQVADGRALHEEQERAVGNTGEHEQVCRGCCCADFDDPRCRQPTISEHGLADIRAAAELRVRWERERGTSVGLACVGCGQSALTPIPSCSTFTLTAYAATTFAVVTLLVVNGTIYPACPPCQVRGEDKLKLALQERGKDGLA